jgi:hypothetical protein
MPEIYVVLIEDRHCDVGVELLATKDYAISRARKLAAEYGNPEDIKETTVDGLPYIVYSIEGDSITVLKKNVKENPDT